MAVITRTISDLQEISTVTDEHVLIVENGITTNKVTKANLLKELSEQMNTELAAKVDKTTYDAKVASLQADINNRLLKSEYDTKIASLQTDINSKATLSDFNTKATELQSAIDAKVSTIDFDDKVSELQEDIDSRVLTADYDAKITEIEGSVSTNTANITNNKTDYDAFKANAEARIAALETATLTFRVINESEENQVVPDTPVEEEIPNESETEEVQE